MKVSSETNSIKQDESVPFFFLFFLVQVEGNLLSEKKDEIRSMESLRSFKVANAVVLTTFLVDNLSLFCFQAIKCCVILLGQEFDFLDQPIKSTSCPILLDKSILSKEVWQIFDLFIPDIPDSSNFIYLDKVSIGPWHIPHVIL